MTPDSIQRLLAQKIMVDLRYYCDRSEPGAGCRDPMIRLPAAVADLIAEIDLGGVCLFAENFVSAAQATQLGRDLQTAAARAPSGLPLLVAVDQEGGRVVRLPRSWSTSFAGNMAIGATMAAHHTHFAFEVGEAIGEELSALGININCAPCIDVNSNPANPVINTRAFGDDPEQVAALGVAMARGLRRGGVMACAKHFPGHGDTSTDSHTGLPCVSRSRESLYAIDLLPFRRLVEANVVDLVMSAHIQCPALDDSTLLDRRGQPVMVPATLSRRMLSGLLRDEFGFSGVIVSDALDMAAITNLLDPATAVLRCFAAGVDLALMPCRLRCPADIDTFRAWLQALAAAVADGALDHGELQTSASRMTALRASLPVHQAVSADTAAHRELERELAKESLTALHDRLARPLGSTIAIAFSDPAHAAAMSAALHQLDATIPVRILSFDVDSLATLHAEECLLLGYSASRANLAALGGAGNSQAAVRSDDSIDQVLALLKVAGARGALRVCLSVDSPYVDPRIVAASDALLLSYHVGSWVEANSGRPRSPSLQAVAAWLLSDDAAPGRLPVRINDQQEGKIS